MNREDMKHHMSMLITEGHLHLAPIDPNPQMILDIGTGTGKYERYPTLYILFTNYRRDLGH